MKIVYLSDSPTLTTGYGRVSRVLCEALVNAGHEVTAIGWGYRGEEHHLPYKIIPCDTQKDRWGEDILANFIRNEKPDILFTLGDPWMTEYVPGLEERSAVTWISYFPIDGYPIPPVWHKWIKNSDVPVVFSKFARNLIKKEVDVNPRLIYHGVDTDIFKPLDKEKIKEDYGASDLFVVGTVARNQPRKNLPALIKAFAKFAENKDDVALYMHSQVVDVGWNLEELVVRFGLESKAFTTSNFSAAKGVPDDELVKIYNLFDIFCLPTMAEGFGLPILEAQSCGVPVLVTDYSACSELVVDRQELIKVKDTLILGRNIEQAVADTDDIVHKLNIFYDDWKRKSRTKLIDLGKRGRALATAMDWKLVSEDFISLLSEIEPKALARDKKIKPSFFKI